MTSARRRYIKARGDEGRTVRFAAAEDAAAEDGRDKGREDLEAQLWTMNKFTALVFLLALGFLDCEAGE